MRTLSLDEVESLQGGSGYNCAYFLLGAGLSMTGVGGAGVAIALYNARGCAQYLDGVWGCLGPCSQSVGRPKNPGSAEILLKR